MGAGGNLEYRKNPETGEIELWRTGYVSFKGFTRGQSLPDTFLGIVPKKEWEKIQKSNDAIEAEWEENLRQRLEANRLYETYCDNLPSEIDGYFRKKHQIEDSYGNFICSIPLVASKEKWNIEKLLVYINKMYENT